MFDAERLVPIVQELLERIPDTPAADPRLRELAQTPTAVDGTLLLKLPQITQARFASRRDHGWKLHTHFEVLRGGPTRAHAGLPHRRRRKRTGQRDGDAPQYAAAGPLLSHRSRL